MWRLLRRIGRLNPLLLGPFKSEPGFTPCKRFSSCRCGDLKESESESRLALRYCVIAKPGHESRIRWYLE